jgi:anti-sigma regulatory factor (Ser/Thr protein kinase)
MTVTETTLTLPARLESLGQGIAFVVACATAAGLPPRRVTEIELVTEETLVNICKYAYHDQAGSIEIRCVQTATEQLNIAFVDTGKPFNLLELPLPDLTADVEARQVGGLGVLLIRAMVDNITYCREGGRNILCLAIQLLR